MTAQNDRGREPVGRGAAHPPHSTGTAGTGLGSQTSQSRAGRQDGQGGWGAEPCLGTSGLPASGRGGPHSSALPPGGRPLPPLPQDLLCAPCRVLEARPCRVESGRVRCVPRGVEQSSSLGKPWQGPARPSVPGLARQEQVGSRGSLAALPPGSERLIHPFTSCGPMSRS